MFCNVMRKPYKDKSCILTCFFLILEAENFFHFPLHPVPGNLLILARRCFLRSPFRPPSDDEDETAS